MSNTERLSVAQLQAIMGKSSGTGARRSKYGNKRVGGHASKKEHDRAAQLALMQKAGQITGLREQVDFLVRPTRTDEHGMVLDKQKIYRADFVYYDHDGNFVVEDAKGFRTKEYKEKRDLMLRLYGIRILET